MTTWLEPRLRLALDRFLLAQPFYPCCLLVHASVARLAEIGDALASIYAWPSVSLGDLLAGDLLPVPLDRRPTIARDLLMADARNHGPGPRLYVDTDILFEPSLRLDPLRLLLDASRHTRLVVTWPGAWSGGVLTYAEPAHAHYRSWQTPGLCQDCIITV